MKRGVPTWAWLVLIMLLALFLRFGWISVVPSGISHDELDYYLGGKFLAYTGSDMSGEWRWWQIKPMRTGTITAELPAVFYAATVGRLPSNLMTAKLLPVLFGTGMIILMYALMCRLTNKNKQIALWAAFLMAVNPWSIIYSRTGYEVTFALFWYLLALTSLLYVGWGAQARMTKAGLLITSMITLALGYFSYHGFKLLAPFVVAAGIFAWRQLKPSLRKQNVKWVSIGLISWSFTLIVFSIGNLNNFGDRATEVINWNQPEIIEEINQGRNLTFSPQLTFFLENRYSALIKQAIHYYIGFFTLERMFYSAHDNFNLDFSAHGYFYLVEMALVVTGMILASKKRQLWLLFILLLIAPIPAAMHRGVSYGIRAQFALVPLIGFSALGIHYFWHKWQLWGKLCLVTLLGLSIAHFGYVYFIRYSILSVDQYQFKERLISSYVVRQAGEQMIVIGRDPYNLAKSLVFYDDMAKKKNSKDLQQQFRTNNASDYRINQFLITSDCMAINEKSPNPIIVEFDYLNECRIRFPDEVRWTDNADRISIGSPIDSREYYKIFHPSLCTNQVLPHYIHVGRLNFMAIESLTSEEFCKHWVFKPL